jgi:hypothetical protein
MSPWVWDYVAASREAWHPALAHPKHQRPVASDESRERRLVPACHEALEQFPVCRLAIVVLLHDAAEMADDAIQLSCCHGRIS